MKTKTELPFLERQLLRMLKDSQGVIKGIVDGWKQARMAAFIHGLDMKWEYRKGWQGVWAALQPRYQRIPLECTTFSTIEEVIDWCDAFIRDSFRLPEEVLNGEDASWEAECSKADPVNDLRSMQEVVRNQVGYYE